MKNKNTYIITGASKGIGRVFAITVAKLGADMALLARTATDLEELKTELMQINTQINVSTHPTDLADPTQTKLAFDAIYATHGHSIKAVVCFAGAWVKSKSLGILEVADFMEGLQANFFCTFNTIKEAVRICNQELKGLSIITIGGTSSVWMNPESAIMCVAKGAISNYSRIVAKQLLPKEVHVAHLLIDGPILNERGQYLNPTLQKEEFIKPESVAQEVHHVINQSRDAWTFEWDIRPFTRDTRLF